MDANQIRAFRGDAETPDAVKKAREDFQFVLSQSNFLAPNYLGYQSIVKNGVTLGYALAVPFNVEEKECTVPEHLVKKDDPKMYVAAVCYKGGRPVDVLMFNSALFAKCKKPIDHDKKKSQYVLHIKDIGHSSMQMHAFGYVIGNL